MHKRAKSRSDRANGAQLRYEELGGEYVESDHRTKARFDFLADAAGFLDRFYPTAQDAMRAKPANRALDDRQRYSPLVRRYADDHLRVSNRICAPVSSGVLTQLLLAFGDPGAMIILGAGASSPQVPTTNELASKLGSFSRLPHHIALGRRDSSLERFFNDLADNAFICGRIDIEQVLFFRHQVAASLAVLWGQVFEKAWTSPRSSTKHSISFRGGRR